MQPSIDIQGFRLSPQQKRLWVLQQTFGVAYVQGTLIIDGVLDIVRLERIVNAAVAKHEAFRTLFCTEPGVRVPLQVIAEKSGSEWEIIELPESDASARRQEVLEDHRRRAIAWEQGPLVRCTLCRLSERKHWLVISLPALCADARTLHNLAVEIAADYGVVEQRESGEEPVQYAQFAEWQNELLADDDAAKSRQFWQDVLAEPTTITVPFERVGEETSGWSKEILAWDLHPEVVASLMALSTRLNTSLEALVLAAWQVVLSRVGGRRDYHMALLSDGRTYEELESGMGLFAKWVPLRCQIDPNESFSSLAAAVASEQARIREWQEYFMWDRVLERTGLTTAELVGFEYHTVEPLTPAGDIVFSFEPSAVRFEPLKLTLTCVKRGASIQLSVQADSKKIHGSTLMTVREALSTLLTGAAAQPDTGVGLLPFLGESQQRRLLQAGRGPAHPLPAGESLVTLFEHHANVRPDAIAVICGDCRLTYAELNARANQIAHGLHRMQIGRGALVGLCVERSVEMVAGLLGVQKAGAAYVPLDPENSQARLAFEISQAGIGVVLTQEKWLSQLPASGTPVRCLDFHGWIFADEPSGNPDRPAHPMELAYVMYTSGSTGVPKGVAVTHLGVLNYTDFIQRAVAAKPGLSFATVSTLGADLGNTVIFAALASGGCLHVIGYETATDGRKFMNYCARHPIDVLKIVPAHFQALLATSERAEVLPRRLLVMGGDVLSHALADHVTALGRCRVLNHYGPTEATIGCLTLPVEAEHEGKRFSATVPIGRPIDNAEAYVLDERLDPVPVGVPGELYLAGAGLARGYLGRSDLTAQRFIPHPLASEPGSRLYKTGDLARVLPDGTVEFLGRTDFQIKLRGYRIELGEIEARLTEHPGIEQAVVTARESEAHEKYLAAYIVPRDSDGEPAGWRAFLKERLPDYMIPTALVCLPGLPLNQNGKVDRALLPDPEVYLASSRRYVAPRNPAEEMLTGIWSIILKRDRIGIHDNFFDLGGHSLLATQVIARVRSVFRVDLPLRTLFEATTVAQLAETIESTRLQSGDVVIPPVARVDRSRPVPLSFAQQRLWVLAQLDPDNPSYNIPIALRVVGAVDVLALEKSFNEVVRRHEVLRTRFVGIDGQPMQVISPMMDIPLRVIDLGHLPEGERETTALRLATAEAKRPFELAYGPMLRTSLLRLSEREHVLLVTLHHIVSDAWSAGILVREITALYRNYAAGQPSPLPDLSIQYADFACWQRQWLSGNHLEAQLAYWKTTLGNSPQPVELPTDHPRPAVQTFRGASVTVMFPADLSDRIHSFSRHQGVTVFMTMLSGFYVLLFRYTGQTDLVVGSPIANRTRRETEELIGFFVNTLALRVELSGNPMAREVVERVRTACLDAYTHQDLPFEKLVEVLQPVRDVSRSPLFQVMFDMQNVQTPEVGIQGLHCTPFESGNHTAKFDLTLTVHETEQGLTGSIEYNTDLFEETTIQRQLSHFQTLLEGMVTQPETHIAALPLLSKGERQRLLVDWNSTKNAYPQGMCLHELIEGQVEKTPDAVAVVCQDQHVTYRELNQRANQLAHYLRQHGVGPDVLVGVCLERSVEMVVSLLGTLKAGGAYVPIDPDYPSDRIAFMLEDTRPALLLTQRHLAAQLHSYTGWALCLDTDWPLIARQPTMNPHVGLSPLNLAYTIYTSGSTGRPKGAGNTHLGLLNRLQWMQDSFHLCTRDRVLQKTPFSFDVSVWEFFWPLMIGAGLAVAGPGEHRNPARLVELITKHQVTTIHFVPPMLHVFLETAGVDACRCLRRVICSGEALPAELQRRFFMQLAWAELHNLYGPTEAAIDVTAWACEREGDATSVPIGRPISNTYIYLLDRQNEPVPSGVPGELHIGGVGVARGYHRRPELTAEKFVPDPFSAIPGSRLYKTGDVARYREDGVIEYIGRRDHQVKIRGFRVELSEVEAWLSKHSAVREVVVLAREDQPDDKRLVAYLVLAGMPPELTPSANDLRQFLREQLPEYMIPAAFLILAELPRTANGKIDRKLLPAPDFSGQITDRYMAPRTRMENELAEMWAEMLHVERVGIYDNFFDLGGHSLLAVQLMSRIRKTIGGSLSLLTIFQAPTVESLAGILSNSRRDSSSPLVALRDSGSRLPLYCFDPDGTHVLAYQPLAYSLNDEQPVYGLSLSRIFSMDWSTLSIAAIAEDHVHLIRRHQPEGPYHLLGWSNGGVIALAVAHALERQDQAVSFLGVLDTQTRVGTIEDPTVLDELFPYLSRDHQHEFLALPEEERQALQKYLVSLTEDNRVEYAIQWAQERGFLSPEESETSTDVLKVGYALNKEANRTLHAYRKRPLRAPIHAWWTSATLSKHGKAPVDWTLYTRGTVEIGTVLGEHADAVQSIQVHQRISEILAAERVSGAHKESHGVQP